VRTLYRAISGKEVGGEPLPLTFKSLQQNEIVLRRAELNLIAGTPGAGKSSIALAIAVQAQVPTLYMSADTNAHTMGMRVVAMATGMTQSNAEQILKQDKDSAENILKQFDYLRWSFESSPTLSKEGFIGTPCQPRSAIQGLVNQIPALILTIGQEIIGESIYLCVAAVKNRYGRADATGNTFTMLSFDPASMQLKDVKTSD